MGIAGLGMAPPWGEHLCVFYSTRSDFLRLITPYIAAGLQASESCTWISASSTPDPDVYQRLEAELPDLHDRINNKQLEIVSCGQWSRTDGTFYGEAFHRHWGVRSEHAIEKGFKGMRVACDPSALMGAHEGALFKSYETTVRNVIQSARMLMLCMYPVKMCSPEQMMETFQCHGVAVMPHNRDWKRVALNSPT